MGQAAKYAILGVAFAAVIVVVVAIVAEFFGYNTSLGNGLAQALSVLGGFFRNTRGLINYLIGNDNARAVFAGLLYGDLFFSAGVLALKIAVAVIRFINQ